MGRRAIQHKDTKLKKHVGWDAGICTRVATCKRGVGSAQSVDEIGRHQEP